MDELFGNGNEMNEDALPVNAEAEDLFEDDAVSEIMKDTDRLSALEESYIAEVEERAAGIRAHTTDFGAGGNHAGRRGRRSRRHDLIRPRVAREPVGARLENEALRRRRA